MCTVCGCGDTVTVDGREMSHDEAHRLGLAHSHGPVFRPAAPALPFPHIQATADRASAPSLAAGHHHYGTGPAGVSVPGLTQARLIEVETSILAKNDAFAASNRRVLDALRVLALNLVSSPGSGKTTLLCKTIEALGDAPLAVIEGDQQTSNDADRIRATGARALQINTGKGCHLDAHMVGTAIDALRPAAGSFLFIENVGNLVCPAGFDLGEDAKVAILSVTEGEDKPLKYPDMFSAARLAILNKLDLAPHCDVDLAAYTANLRRVNPNIEIIALSARTGAGMAEWLGWLRARLAEKAA
ncbi:MULTISPECIES: hydrogenase nickel incorporation protein HypB [Gemmobacter]|uniref:Hydrogenase maturation factor HypB n=2 Tax=Gemmobacter TaxID=204456 RepID=A0A2T6AYZ0_9RHOB|nr:MULTISPECIES: hydrogenase nickel incorporation protein HypB [Gemmobacter]OJY35225.1 MAG: hydrogenase accessory protein HypB [Rhodobacterales bacterium 65-51]PTX49027.1 hydrogenase nickel incorporation protein HypB [Gemmobacter caeni]TWI98972.1 hydrogenase nickel incorporation protein HypB [Gemmobacter caeni]GHC31463.1 hydrogenase accessory protein HypB [Gemmobacter nanjingensis]